jgi:hypothetical protein
VLQKKLEVIECSTEATGTPVVHFEHIKRYDQQLNLNGADTQHQDPE